MLLALETSAFPYQGQAERVEIVERFDAIASGELTGATPTPTRTTPQYDAKGRRIVDTIEEFFAGFQRGISATTG